MQAKPLLNGCQCSSIHFNPLLNKFEVSLQALPLEILLCACLGPFTPAQNNKLEKKQSKIKNHSAPGAAGAQAVKKSTLHLCEETGPI